MAEQDRERWNRRWLERAEAGETLAEPSRFVVAADGLLPRHGRAIDLGGGTGRHALWLARRGLDVTLVDISDEALALATRAAAAEKLPLTCVRADLEIDAPPGRDWDVALIFHFLHRPLLARIPELLAPGGWFLFCQPTRRNLERHPRPGPDYLLAEGELPGLVRDLDVVSYEEGWSDEGRHEARLIARRRR